MLALPHKPTTPILLLVAGVCVILATIVHALSISGRDWRCRRVVSKSSSNSRSDPESSLGQSKESLDLGYFNHHHSSRSRSRSKTKPHPAFLCLVGIAVVLGIAAAAIERRSVSKALGVWDETTATQIGLTASLGPLAHRKSLKRIKLRISNPLDPLLPLPQCHDRFHPPHPVDVQ
jgi:hypothetical protein